MPMEVDFSQVTKQLQELAKKAQKHVISEALDAGSEVIINEMKDECPIDTGELQESIGEIKRTGSGLNRKAIIGINSNDKRILERAFYQEYGTVHRNANKFMKRSFQGAIKEANEAIVDSLLDNLL